MISRILYFVTDCDYPRFPLTAIARHFRIVSIPVDFSDHDWFNWESTGCIVFECRELKTAVALLKNICSEWISVPTAVYNAELPTDSVEACRSRFSVTFDGSLELSTLVKELNSLMEFDQTGDPSPLELRRRFGTLANQERRVLQHSLEGLTSKEIASRLGIRSQTVDKYKRNGLARMKTRNITLLLRLLYQSLLHQSNFFKGNLTEKESMDLSLECYA